jgi:uncharacterized coiled-coil protein SlyX
MAAILQLRRGTSPSTTISEPYFNTGLGTIQIGDGSTSITLVKIGSNTGNVSLVGNLSITGNLTVSENITFGGNLITLGDANTDNIVISGELSSSLVPNNDDAFDLGSSLKRYKNLYVVSASIDNISLPGSNIVSSSEQISTYGVFLEIGGDNIFSGSSQIDLTQTTNYITGIKTRLNVETVISGSSQITYSGISSIPSGIVSGSSQVTSLLPSGTFSGSSQVVYTSLSSIPSGIVSGSSQITPLLPNGVVSGSSQVVILLPNGVVSGSAQVLGGTGIVSGSSQVNADSITNFDTNVKDKLNTDGVISGSSQVNITSTTGTLDISSRTNLAVSDTPTIDMILTGDTLSANAIGGIVSGSSQVSYIGLSNIPSGIISGSSQISSVLPSGVVSGSSQITYSGISSIPSGIVSGSSQISADQTEGWVTDVKTRLNVETVISGSTQVNADNITNFDTNVKDKLNTDGVVSGSSQITYSGISSIPSGIVSGSTQVKSLLPSGVVSGSTQVNADNITNFDTNVKDKLNTDLVVSGSASSVKTFLSLQNVTNESKATMFSSPTFTGTVSGVTAAHVGLGNVTNESKATMFTNAALTGNPTAPTQTGTDDSTKIATTAFVQDRINFIIGTAGSTLDTLGELSASLADDSGSLAGLITTVGGKLQKDQNLLDLTDTSVARTNLGVAIGTNVQAYNATLAAVAGGTYSGDDSITTIGTVTAGNVTAILPSGVVSGSIQVLGGTGIVSGSSQVVYTSLSSIPSGIVSGSSQITYSGISSIPSGIVSSSSQVTSLLPTGVVSGSSQVTSSLDLRYLLIDGDNVFTGSSQVDLTQTTNYISGIKTRLNTEGVFSSSIQVNANDITNFDTNVKDKLNVDGVISGSSQVQINSVTGFTTFSSSVDSRLDTLEGSFSTSVDSRLDNLELDSASQDLRLDNLESTTQSLDNRLDNVELFTSSYFTDSASVDSRLDTLEGSFSTSVDSRLDYIEGEFSTSLDSRLDLLENFSSSQYINDSQSFDTRLDYLEGDFSTSLDSRLDSVEGDQHTHSNKANLDEINQDLATTDAPSFIGLSLTSLLPQPTSSIEFDAVFLSSSNELTYRTLGNAILYNVTSSQDIVLESGSIAYASDNLLTAGAVKKYVDWRTEELVTAIGAADITSVTANAGLTGGGLTGAVTLSLDTGSVHFNNGVVSNLVSLNSFTQSYFTDSASIDTRLDGLESFSSSLDSGFVTEAELASATGSLINSIATKLNTGSYNTDSASFDSRIDVLESDSISQDGRLDNLELTTASFDGRLDNLELDSASQDGRLDNIELFTSSIDTIIKTKLNIEGVISGSDQLTSSYDSRYVNETDFTSFSSSVDGRLDLLETNSSSLENIFEEKASGTHTLVSGSSQVLDILSSLNTYTGSNNTTNTTQNSRLDQLSTYTGSNETAQSAQNSRLSSLETKTGSLDTEQSAQNSRLNQLSTYTGSNDTTNTTQNSRLSSLETKTGSLDTEQSAQNSRLNQLSTYTGSNDTTNTTQNSRLDQLSTYTGSNDTINTTQNSRLSQIESVTSSLDSTYEEKASGTHTLVSGSSQIQLIKTDSGSFSTNMVVEGSNLYYTDTRVKTKLNTEGVISGSDQLTGSLVDLTSDQTISGTKTFNDIVVNGTGSFAYITSVSGTAKIIGDAFIVLNTDTPTSRYAGLSVYDSGSTLSTASFYYDGETNDWGYEYSSSTGVDYAVTIFGPEYNTKGNPSYLTTNKIPKAVDNHHLNDSNITDTGTLITLGSNTIVNGTLLSTGTSLVSGSSQINFTQLSGISSNIISASSDTAQVDMIITGGSISANLKGGVVSGSSQITYSGISSIPSGIVSSSAQVKSLLPSGTASGSSQIDITLTTGTLDISSRTNLAVSDTAQVDMILTDDTLSANLKGGVVSGSSQINFTQLSGISSNIISASSDSAQVDMIITGGSISANLKGGVVSGSSQIDITTTTGTLDISSRTNLAVSDTTNVDMILTGDTLSANLKGGVVSGSGQLTDMTGDITVNSSGVSAIGNGVIVNTDVNASAAIAYTKLNLGGSGIVSGSTQITKTLQDVTTAGNTTSTTISITNTTASTSKTTGALIVSGGIGTSGGVFAGGDVVAYASSDIRLKDNILPIENPLQKINSIGGYSFVWNENQDTYKGKDYGVIAQEIEEILPELVDTRENGYKAVKYDKLVSLLIEGIKELSSEVEELKRKLNT